MINGWKILAFLLVAFMANAALRYFGAGGDILRIVVLVVVVLVVSFLFRRAIDAERDR